MKGISALDQQWDGVADFEQALAHAAALASAGDPAAERATLASATLIYRGGLLPSCYDEWILPERERLHQAFLGALERLIQLSEEQHDYPVAIDNDGFSAPEELLCER